MDEVRAPPMSVGEMLEHPAFTDRVRRRLRMGVLLHGSGALLCIAGILGAAATVVPVPGSVADHWADPWVRTSVLGTVLGFVAEVAGAAWRNAALRELRTRDFSGPGSWALFRWAIRGP